MFDICISTRTERKVSDAIIPAMDQNHVTNTVYHNIQILIIIRVHNQLYFISLLSKHKRGYDSIAYWCFDRTHCYMNHWYYYKIPENNLASGENGNDILYWKK